MPMNPMQRKARNSFLLGMLVMLVIAGIIIGIMFMSILNTKKTEQVVAQNARTVYIVKTDIKSGEPIEAADLIQVKVGYTDAKTNQIVTTNIAQNEALTTGDLEEGTIAKIDLPKGTYLSKSMVTTSSEDENSRIQEFNMILLPTDLTTEDYVDVRIRYSNGQDYIVLAKKRVVQSSQNTIFLKMNEEEISTMSNAIVESYIAKGALIYADKYTDAGIQTASTVTYPVSRDVLALINSDPNIVEKARNALWARYEQQAQANQRLTIDTILSQSTEDATESVQSGIDEQIQKQQQERARYIQTLGGTDY